MAVNIRMLNTERSLVLDSKYTLDDVTGAIEAASSRGERALIFDGHRGEKFVVSVGGTEPYTIRDRA